MDWRQRQCGIVAADDRSHGEACAPGRGDLLRLTDEGDPPAAVGAVAIGGTDRRAARAVIRSRRRTGFHALEQIWRELSASSRTANRFSVLGLRGRMAQSLRASPERAAPPVRFTVLVAFDSRAGVIGLMPLFEEHLLGEPTFGTTLQPFGRSQVIETLTDEPIAIFRRGYESRATADADFQRSAKTHATEAWDIAVVYGARRRQPTGRPFCLHIRPARQRRGRRGSKGRSADGGAPHVVARASSRDSPNRCGTTSATIPVASPARSVTLEDQDGSLSVRGGGSDRSI